MVQLKIGKIPGSTLIPGQDIVPLGYNSLGRNYFVLPQNSASQDQPLRNVVRMNARTRKAFQESEVAWWLPPLTATLTQRAPNLPKPTAVFVCLNLRGFGAMPNGAQRLLLILKPGITPGVAPETTWGAGNGPGLAEPVQGKCLT